MIGLFLVGVAFAEPTPAVPGEELSEEIEVQRSEREVVFDHGANNRGRVGGYVAIHRWNLPGLQVSGHVQVHGGPLLAVHLEAATLSHTLLDNDGERVTAVLPQGAVGVVFDPVREGPVRPQGGVDATFTLWQLSDDGPRIAPGFRARAGADFQIIGPVNFSIEGLLGVIVANKLSLRTPLVRVSNTVSSGLRGGLVLRW